MQRYPVQLSIKLLKAQRPKKQEPADSNIRFLIQFQRDSIREENIE